MGDMFVIDQIRIIHTLRKLGYGYKHLANEDGGHFKHSL